MIIKHVFGDGTSLPNNSKRKSKVKGKRINADELVDVQLRGGVMSDLHGRTTPQCIVTALYHILIIMNVNVESISQPCSAICWALSVIGIALLVLVMPMLHELQF